MAFHDFQDKMKQTRSDAERKYIENSDEAWGQIKDLFANPTYWIVTAITLLLIVAGVFTVKFLGAIRAPAVPVEENNPGQVLAADPERQGTGPESAEEIDDSNTERPVLSGPRKEDYYTFLLIGTDASSSNTDTLMVASYDVANQKLNLMSIPRDTMVNVSWDIKKINSVYGRTGLNGLKKHIGKLIGFVPDYYVKIDLNAFIEVIDLIGGVDFDVPRDMNYDDDVQDLHIHFKKGMQHLSGQQAMELVRWRKNNRTASGTVSGYDDTGRIQTQQAFLKAALKQALSIRNWTKITGYVEIFQRDVESDLTLGEMLWFARQAMDLGEDGFETCTIPGNYYASAWSRSTDSMQSYVTLYPRQVIQQVNEGFNPYLANVTMSNLDIMSINSDGSVSSSTGYVADSLAAQPPATDDREPDGDEETDGGNEPGDGEPDETAPTGENTGTAGSGTGTGGGTGEGTAGGEGEEPSEQELPEEPAEPSETEEPREEADTEPAPLPEDTDTTPIEDGAE